MRFEYAQDSEARSLVALRDSYGLFIGGSFAGTTVRPFRSSPAFRLSLIQGRGR